MEYSTRVKTKQGECYNVSMPLLEVKGDSKGKRLRISSLKYIILYVMDAEPLIKICM